MTNQENNLEAINTEDQLADLSLQEIADAEVKGGAIYMKVDGVKGRAHDESGPTPQTREHILLAKQ